MTNLPIYLVGILALALVQVSIVSLPLGLGFIFAWQLKNKSDKIEWLLVGFAFFIASLSALPISLVFLATGISLLVLILLKAYMPSGVGVSILIFLIMMIVWIGSLTFMTRLWTF